jgi:hypothetical protein
MCGAAAVPHVAREATRALQKGKKERKTGRWLMLAAPCK